MPYVGAGNMSAAESIVRNLRSGECQMRSTLEPEFEVRENRWDGP